MNASLGERLIVPAVLAVLFALMSRAFMVGVGGSTRRMRTVWWCAVGFITSALYSIAWQDKLADACGNKDAWVLITLLLAIAAVLVCIKLLKRGIGLHQASKKARRDGTRPGFG